MKIDDKILAEMHKDAKEVYHNAYSPYSKFHVAASILCRDGRIFTGVNIENASFGLTRCAEQIAIGNAITNGCREIDAVLVITRDGTSWPCGACRQILAEFNINMMVYTADENEIKAEKSLNQLIPYNFSSEEL